MTSPKVLTLLFGVLLLNSVIYAHDEITCNHGSELHESQDLDVDEDMSAFEQGGDRLLANRPNMRMMANYDHLSSAPSDFERYVKNELVPPVLSWFSGALRVKSPLTGLLKSNLRKTCDVATPSQLKSGVNADIYVIFNSHNADNTIVASSRHCETAPKTKRPITAYTDINRNMLKVASGNVLIHEKNMYLVIHELMHVLGISPNSYYNYIDNNGKTRKGHIKSVKIAGQTQSVIDLPELTQRLRRFYGCNSVPGLILEGDGGSGNAGSHFERRYFVYDSMSSGAILSRRVTEFSLALLEGSGWYYPNYDYAEPYFFGQGQGCDFINKKCSSSNSIFDEFCSGSERGCAPQGRAGGRCQGGDSKADGCKYVKPEEDHDCENSDAIDNARFPDLEVYGRKDNSKCFEGTLNSRKSNNGKTSFCFKYTCSGSGSNTELAVQVGRNRVVCTEKGTRTIDGYYGNINCPDPLTFCNTVGRKYCPRNCMGRGDCQSGKCVCDSGFTGIDCGLYV